MRKIGIFGGTFHPIHIGHLVLADQAMAQYQLSQIWFMPSKRPPHKQSHQLCEDEHRKNMVRLAIESNPAFQLCEIEFEREELSYTSDTLKLLQERYPEDEFYFLMGGDSVMYLDAWHEPAEIFRLAHILASSRTDISREQIDEKLLMLRQQYGARIDFVDMPNIDVSSHEIREGVADGKPVRYYLTEKVYQYIIENRLFLV